MLSGKRHLRMLCVSAAIRVVCQPLSLSRARVCCRAERGMKVHRTPALQPFPDLTQPEVAFPLYPAGDIDPNLVVRCAAAQRLLGTAGHADAAPHTPCRCQAEVLPSGSAAEQECCRAGAVHAVHEAAARLVTFAFFHVLPCTAGWRTCISKRSTWGSSWTERGRRWWAMPGAF